MSRTIPIALQDHLDSGVTTTTLIMRIDPVTPGFSSFGASMTNRRIVYDDLTSELVYHEILGMQPSTIMQSANLSVDNAQVESLLPEFEFPISETDIAAGVYDFAEFSVYLVNYEDLTPGNHVVLAHGTLGRMRMGDGLSFWQELRGLTDPLKQSACEKDSLTCRATFGSQPIGTGGGVTEERYPCMYDAEALWEAGTVDAVGAESNRTFETAGLAPPFGGVPGKVRWITGANAGRENEVESFDDVAGVQTISLGFPADFPIAEGDTFEFRDDCPKTKPACQARENFEWMRAEPHIPIGDAGAMEVPGASSGPGRGGTSYQPITEAV